MSVTSVILLHDGRSGEFSLRERSRRYTCQYSVRTSDRRDGSAVVLAYLSSAAMYATYATGNDVDTAAIVENIKVDGDGLCKWIATVEFSTVTLDGSGKQADFPPERGNNSGTPQSQNPLQQLQQSDNPIDRNPVVRWSRASYQVPVMFDERGIAVVNSVGDPFDPPIEREEKRRVLVYERYQLAFSQELADQYQYAVNSETWMGALPGCVRCNGMEGERYYEKGYLCWRVRYEFEFRRESHQGKYLDQGYRRLNADGKPTLITDSQQRVVSAPVCLDGEGGPLERCQTTLNDNVTIDDVFLPVADVDVFPTPPFQVRVDDEIINVEGKSDTPARLTNLTRGYQGSAALAHADGAGVAMLPVYLSYQIYRELPFGPLNIVI